MHGGHNGMLTAPPTALKFSLQLLNKQVASSLLCIHTHTAHVVASLITWKRVCVILQLIGIHFK